VAPLGAPDADQEGVKPLGLLVTFAGYTLAYFGWCSLRGPGVGLVDLLVPGRPITIPGGPEQPASKSGFAPGAGVGGGTSPGSSAGGGGGGSW
jgi:hypothetical protein